MMNRNQALSFSDPRLSAAELCEEEAPVQTSLAAGQQGGLRLLASVCGNVLVGTALIGGLMLAPQLLAFVLGMV